MDRPVSSRWPPGAAIPAVKAAVPSRPGRGRIERTHGNAEEHAMDKKAKTPKKPKQTKSKDGAAKGK
jgi:hypothetical protein